MRSFIILLTISTLSLINPIYAFCVYNKTTGNIPGTKVPIAISYMYKTKKYENGGKSHIQQNDFKCSRTKSRGQNDFSWVYTRIEGEHRFHEACFPSIPSPHTVVYNAGGYLVVTGSYVNGKLTIECHVYRD